MLDYNSNNKDWLEFKLSKLGIYETKNIGKAMTTATLANHEEIVDKNAKEQDNVYKLGDSYYEFQRRDLTKEDEIYIQLKFLDELDKLNANTKSIKKCIVFFTILAIISLVAQAILILPSISALFYINQL